MAHQHLLASAVLATALTAPPGASSDNAPASGTARIQLFPAGSFASRDGRPASMATSKVSAWRLTASDAAALMSRWKARATPVVIDYEHQTHLTETNGQPAPAAGWITALEWTAGSGLFATVEWTARARAHIAAKEYRFISPTFRFDRVSGAVLEIASAALTNNPALDGMDAVQASHTTYNGDLTMNKKLLALLRTVLGLPETADEAACEAALGALPQEALPALLTAKDAEITSLKTAAPNPAQFAPVALLTATQAQLTAVQAELTTLKASTATAELTAEIDAALTDGRLHAQGKDWATSLAKTDPEALRAYLKTAPPIAALKGQQTNGGTPPSASGAASLTQEEEYVCAQLCISREDYIKAKENN